MKASNLVNRQLSRAETIRAKVAAHQESGFSAFGTSNYLGDHLENLQTEKNFCARATPFVIYYLLCGCTASFTLPLHRDGGAWTVVLHGLCFNIEVVLDYITPLSCTLYVVT